ncbi:MAG: TrkA family potassium uptake protein [Dehalococcoidia bacterium]|nr:MAG: TrkA family potassium uptake protein [Dehalococcoidia bacterium]
MYVIIVGGGKVGLSLARHLANERHEISLIEKDSLRCRHISENSGDFLKLFINGDGTSLGAMDSCEAERADVVVATTGSDPDNLAICQLAYYHYQVPKTIARVNNPRNEEIFEHLGGVAHALSVTKIISDLIQEDISVNGIIELIPVNSTVDIMELVVGKDFRSEGLMIKELGLPKNTIILSIIRENRVIRPTVEQPILIGDRLVLAVKREHKATVKDFFLSPGKYWSKVTGASPPSKLKESD